MQEEVIFPSHNDATALANDFGQFFCQKIITIRSSFYYNSVCATALQLFYANLLNYRLIFRCYLHSKASLRKMFRN